MDAAALSKISADAHVDEPHDLWFERFDRSMRDLAPRRIQADGSGGWTLVIDGSPLGWVGTPAGEAEVLESARLAAVAPGPRLEMMRADGLNGEMIYPTIGMFAWNMRDGEAGRATCRVYNDWILERLGGSPRIRVGAMIPTWTVEMAVAEVARVAGEASVGALMLPLVGTPEWNMPQWEPLWAALAEAGKPVVMHQGTGHEMMFYRGWGSPTANVLATQSMAPRAVGLLSCSGVLERHPGLHFVLVEVNGGWLAWVMQTLDEYYKAHRLWSKPKLAELPSFYIRRQVHATFQDDPVAVHNIPLTGPDCLLWGNDYPHPEGIYPNSNKILSDLLDGVPHSDAVAVTSGNAARLFGFNPGILTTRP